MSKEKIQKDIELKQEMISHLKALNNQLGIILASEDIKESNKLMLVRRDIAEYMSEEDIVKAFKDELNRVIGKKMEIAEEKDSKQNILDYLRSLDKSLGRAITIEDVKNDRVYSTNKIIKEFGSFNNALTKANLPIWSEDRRRFSHKNKSNHRGRKQRYSNDELFEIVHNWIDKHSKIPTRIEWDADKDTPSTSTYKDRFKMPWGEFLRHFILKKQNNDSVDNKEEKRTISHITRNKAVQFLLSLESEMEKTFPENGTRIIKSDYFLEVVKSHLEGVINTNVDIKVRDSNKE